MAGASNICFLIV